MFLLQNYVSETVDINRKSKGMGEMKNFDDKILAFACDSNSNW